MSASTYPAREAVLAWAKDLYDNGVDKRNAAKFASVFTDNGWCRFANNPPLVGRAAIEAAITQFFTLMTGVQHQDAGKLYHDGTVVLEANVTYTLHNGGTVTVPACTIFGLAAGATPRAETCRIYVDLAPLFGSLGS